MHDNHLPRFSLSGFLFNNGMEFAIYPIYPIMGVRCVLVQLYLIFFAGNSYCETSSQTLYYRPGEER